MVPLEHCYTISPKIRINKWTKKKPKNKTQTIKHLRAHKTEAKGLGHTGATAGVDLQKSSKPHHPANLVDDESKLSYSKDYPFSFYLSLCPYSFLILSYPKG